MKRCRHRFSLVEILVAFALLSVALTALTEVLHVSLAMSSDSRTLTQATLLAQRHVERAYSLDATELERLTGAGPQTEQAQGFELKQIVTRHPGEMDGLYRISVVVSWDENGHTREVTLHSLTHGWGAP